MADHLSSVAARIKTKQPAALFIPPTKMATCLHYLATATTTNLLTVSYTKNYNTSQIPGQKQKSNTKINLKNGHKVDKLRALLNRALEVMVVTSGFNLFNKNGILIKKEQR